MTLLDLGLNRSRDLVAADLYSGVAGTGTTNITFADTSLANEDASVTDSSPSISTSNKTITMNTQIGASSGNGNTYTEWGVEGNSGSTLYTRTLSAPISKVNTIEINRIVTFYFDRE